MRLKTFSIPLCLLLTASLVAPALAGHSKRRARHKKAKPAKIEYFDLKPVTDGSAQSGINPSFVRHDIVPRFVQGIAVDKPTGQLLTSNGWWHQSGIGIHTLNPETKKAAYRELSHTADWLKRTNLSDGEKNGTGYFNRKLWENIFAEGLVPWGDKLIQFTWKAEKVLVYDRDKLLAGKGKPERIIDRKGEGWGATVMKEKGKDAVVVSDGSSKLTVYRPDRRVKKLKALRTIEVKDGDRPVDNINEIEFVDGKILANVFIDIRHTNTTRGRYYNGDQILVIDPKSGQVEKIVQLIPDNTDIRTVSQAAIAAAGDGMELAHPPGVAKDRHYATNGIAYDPARDVVFLTGKNWPYLYEVPRAELLGK